ncbi:MAG: T9SS type A sorting domain-containing protein [Ignavibacteria bacterium]|nr:T9SS type A sorting domain-containing protein [Ignavibacteria bacterium]
MKTLKYFVLIIFLSALTFSQQQEFKIISSRLLDDKIAYPGDSQIDVTFYRLNLNINIDSKFIDAAVTVDLRFTEDNVTNFFLDLSNNLVIDSIKSGQSKLSFNHSNSQINITLPEEKTLNDKISVTVFYKGSPSGTGFGSFFIRDDKNAMWTLSEPYGAKDWFPCKDTPADKADSSDVWVTIRSDLYVVSNGLLEDILDNGNGTRTFKWKSRYPIAHYLISMAAGQYQLYTDYFKYSETDSMAVIHYLYPESYNPNTFDELNKTIDMLHIFSELYGIYPFIQEKYGHAQFGWNGGMEHQTVSSMGSFGEWIVAHELAHQWFGDKITCRDWQNIWLNEGFATYSEALYLEKKYGKDFYKSEIAADMENAKYAVGTLYVQDASSISEIFDSKRSYSKGSVVLHMLRNVVGDSTFFRILKTYLEEPELKYNTAVTEDFRAVCERVSGLNLDYFFSQWIYGENCPAYNTGLAIETLENKKYKADVTISQQLNSNPLYFTMPVDLKFVFSSGDTVITVYNNEQNQNFSFVLNDFPEELILDPDDKILKSENVVSVDDISKTNCFELLQNFPNPFNPVTTIKYSIPNNSLETLHATSVQLKVYNLLGQKVATLVNQQQPAGHYKVKFDASSLASGVYIYQLTAGSLNAVKTLMLLK